MSGRTFVYIEDVGDDEIATLDAALDSLNAALLGRTFGRLTLTQDKNRVADGAQRVAQLLRNRRRDLAKDGEPLLLQQFLLRGAQLEHQLFARRRGLRAALYRESGLVQ